MANQLLAWDENLLLKTHALEHARGVLPEKF